MTTRDVRWTGSTPIVALNGNVLRRLRDLAASSGARQEEWHAQRFGAQYVYGYTEGATAVLDWLVTGQPSTELAELLELED